VSSFALASGLMSFRRSERHAPDPARERLEARSCLESRDLVHHEADADDTHRDLFAACRSTDSLDRHDRIVALSLFERNSSVLRCP
jgi:hypothetical protein